MVILKAGTLELLLSFGDDEASLVGDDSGYQRLHRQWDDNWKGTEWDHGAYLCGKEEE